MDLDFKTKVCICGSQMWQPDWVIFDPDEDVYEVAAYAPRMKCARCGTTALCPMPD